MEKISTARCQKVIKVNTRASFTEKKLSLTFPVARIKANVLKECQTWLIAKQLTNTVGSEDTKKCPGCQSIV